MTGARVRQERAGEVMLIAIDSPPVNALGHAVRAGIAAALDAAEADPGIAAVVIAAEGRTFPAGADITEFGEPPAPPALPDLCRRIEDFPKPVVACLHGTALGGGFELALAAHWRVAAPGTRIGLPEVRLGLLPGAGGTVRTPRLAGAAVALDLMLSGRQMPAEEARGAGLIDAVVAEDPRGGAIAFAAELGARGLGVRPTRDAGRGLADAAGYLAAVAAARARVAPSPVPAERRIVDCIEAALLLPFDQALTLERDAFLELLDSPESRALRHAFLAERRAAKVPELAQGRAREVRRAGVVGGGTMGAGIAVALLDAGLPVVLVERDEAAQATAARRVAASFERGVARGRITAAEAAGRLARLTTAADPDALSPCDLVIEAVVEDMEVKRGVLARLDALLAPGAILASNTSYLDLDALAAATGRPGEVVGLHFFSPAQAMPLVEVVVGRATTPDTVATAFALARRLGKIAVRAGVTDGFIGNRVFSAYRAVAEFLLEDGAAVEEVDAAMRGAGFPLGPFEVQDLAGLDIGWARRRRLAPTRDPARRYVAIPDRLCEAGRLGQKTGRGYYLYPEGARQGVPDPEVAALVAAERERKGIVPRAIGAQEIRRRCLAAMANEGARLVAEGVALRPSDVDVVMLNGYGFPRHLGGPMRWADETGLLLLRDDLRRWAQADPFWSPAPLWDALIREGGSFSAMGA
ncbi:MAG: 3-hydroxyacyl-CoA dehydrogenase NAD-binding domain-containing protein [Rhodobacteraceae bacterium]|nr:3-hydroxyacyl-CoA dehydrogenase NAD-binding domain-containing protein [Paracoccaceae bacterium]